MMRGTAITPPTSTIRTSLSRFAGRYLLHGQDERVAEQAAKQGVHSFVYAGT